MKIFLRTVGFCLLLCIQSLRLQAQVHNYGGSIRAYQFFGFEELPASGRRDIELGILRLTDESSFGDHFNLEVHGVLSLSSPPLSAGSRIATSSASRFLPLDRVFLERSNLILVGSFDRMNLRFENSFLEVVVGRQAVTWGVSYFWPALDLFSAFSPERLDRDYKLGVDAVRVIVPLGTLSEVEVIGAALGPSRRKDGSLGALLRWNIGSADVGFMGGTFHRDKVAGAFVTADFRGTGIRGELAWTDSGDAADALRNREEFWRGSVGVDRQLTPSLNLVSELAWNGFGTGDSSLYPAWLAADRIQRGEVNGLGRLYTGVSLTWLAHPLLGVSGSTLVNWNDGSVMIVPSLSWSLGNNSDALFGGQLGLGSGLNSSNLPESEYGSVPNSLFGSLKVYF